MKTVTEFFAIHLSNAAKVMQEQVTAGKTPEELPAAMVEALKPVMKIADDKIPLLLHALEAAEGKAKDLKRVVVYTGPETEKAPAGTMKKGDHYFLVEHFTTMRQSAPDTRDEGRGGRDGKGGKRGGKGGGRDAGRGGPGGGRGPGGPGGTGAPRPAGGAPIITTGERSATAPGGGGDRPRGPRPPRGGAPGGGMQRPPDAPQSGKPGGGGLPKPLATPIMSKTAAIATAVAVTAAAAAVAVAVAVSAHKDSGASEKSKDSESDSASG